MKSKSRKKNSKESLDVLAEKLTRKKKKKSSMAIGDRQAYTNKGDEELSQIPRK